MSPKNSTIRKILLLGHVNWFGQWTEHCVESLRDLGYAVKVIADWECSLDDPLSFNGLSLFLKNRLLVYSLNYRLAKEVVDFQPDLLLILKGENVSAKTLLKIKQRWMDIRIVTWWVDDPFIEWRGHYLHRDAFLKLCYYDWFFISDAFYIPYLKQAGAKRVAFLPLACLPRLYRSIQLSSDEKEYYGSDIAFVGSGDKDREKLLEQLAGFDLAIWGKNWNSFILKERVRSNKGIPIAETAKVYNAAKIVLNLNRPQNVFGTNMRTFEAMACGAFVLNDYRQDLEKSFTIGEEIVCFKDVKELKTLLDYYLANPTERRAIAKIGQLKCHNEHTYHRRMQEIIKIVESSTPIEGGDKNE